MDEGREAAAANWVRKSNAHRPVLADCPGTGTSSREFLRPRSSSVLQPAAFCHGRWCAPAPDSRRICRLSRSLISLITTESPCLRIYVLRMTEAPPRAGEPRGAQWLTQHSWTSTAFVGLRWPDAPMPGHMLAGSPSAPCRRPCADSLVGNSCTTAQARLHTYGYIVGANSRPTLPPSRQTPGRP